MAINPKDLRPMGDPETVVCLPHGDTLVGLYIAVVGSQTMLGIREDRDGQPISCAVTRDLSLKHLPLQSNPHRVKYRHSEDV